MARVHRSAPPRIAFPDLHFYVARPTARPDTELGRLHRHSHHEVQWIARGPAEFHYDFQRYRLPAGSFVWIGPGRAHSWGGDWGAMGLTVIGFDARVFSASPLHERVLATLPFEDLDRPFVTLAAAARGRVQRLLDDLLAHFASGSAPVDLMLSYVVTLMLECHQALRRPVSAAGPAAAMTRRFEALVERDLVLRRKVQDYASELGVNPRYLAACVRTSRRTTPHGLIQQRLFLEARRQLAFEPATIEALAESLGFSDAAQFSHWFRKMGGQSPRQFRDGLDT